MPDEINIVLGKNVQLIGFEKLERAELDIVKKILLKYLGRMEHEVAYTLLKIRLKQHQKEKMFSHEFKADLIVRPGRVITASLQYKNLYNGLNIIMKKLLAGVEHKIKKKLPQHPIRKITRRL
jgi:hypothetical protein